MNISHIIIACLLWFSLLLQFAYADLKLIFPHQGSNVITVDRTFVIGSVQPPTTPLNINGETVIPWRTGGFLYMANVKPGTNTLVILAGKIKHFHTFVVHSPTPFLDSKSLHVLKPTQALGVYTGEIVQLVCIAPTNIVLSAQIGERSIDLIASANSPTIYAADISFHNSVEQVPISFYAKGLSTVSAAHVTAYDQWPLYRVTGRLFETRVCSDPGDGETLGFLTSSMLCAGAGFKGQHTRVWFSGQKCFIDTRNLTPVLQSNNNTMLRNQPIPDIAIGFGPHPPLHSNSANFLILLDPGHGGASTGAIGPTGLMEKNAALKQANVIKTLLENKGYHVMLTRKHDMNLGLYERAQLAYNKKATALISLHYNSCMPSANPQKTRHLATYAWNTIGLQLAHALHPHLAVATKITDAGVKTASFAVCRNPAVPSVLLELDFITDPEGEEAIQQTDRCNRVAEAIYQGLNDWLAPAKH